MNDVVLLSAGPPCGGSYLNPPSSGGLWDGVTTIPSAIAVCLPRLYLRIAWETAGVGVYSPVRAIITGTSFAANTSSALADAGSESACVSMPRNSGPAIPFAIRYAQIACVVARICASLNDLCKEDPRCPEVPNETRCAAMPGP